MSVTALDVFALIVLLVLLGAVVGVTFLLAAWPGRVARERGHPSADAIAVCGWWGLVTLGILLPLAWIWAYTWPPGGLAAREEGAAEDDAAKEETA